MKTTNLTMVGAMMVLLGASLTWSGETPASQTPRPIVKEDVAKLLDDRYIGGSVGFLWPTPSETTLCTGEIDANLRTEAVSWLRKVVLDEFVPSGLAETLIGVRRRLPPRTGNIEMDYLFARYAAAGMSVQFCEALTEMSIVLEPAEPAVPSPKDVHEAQRYLDATFAAVFRCPDLEGMMSKKMTVYSQKMPDGRIVFFGEFGWSKQGNIDLIPDQPRFWYNGIVFFIDGATIGFRFLKADGQPADLMRDGRRW
ncbi:MAG TPA: hypothetical protein VMY42_01470 [Thermoguttaceae bacterium]|nr:hypothetical protein [Thermoguttaceae bacterium]